MKDSIMHNLTSRLTAFAFAANGPDFRSLLSKPADSIEKPKPLPVGTYDGIVAKYELGESKEKKTPFCRVFVTITGAGPDIDPSDLEGVDVSKKQLRKDFYLTEDSLYRFKDFLESVGISTTGRSLGECIPDMVNAAVMVDVSQRPSQDGQELYNDVQSLRGQG